MAGALRKTMVYLGLAEDQGRYDDEYYEGYDEHVEVEEQPEHRGAEVTHLQTRQPVAHVVRSPEAVGISRITTIHPRTYNEAKTIGENFRDGIPVIMNLTDMSDADAKRLVDFAAGSRLRAARLDRAGHQQGVPALAGERRGQRRGRPGRRRPHRLQPELNDPN